MTINLTCPFCNFSKEVPDNAIPARAKRAICPQCHQEFDLQFMPEKQEIGTIQNGFQIENDDTQEESGKGPNRRGAPWEDRSSIGFWQGIYQTFKAILLSPQTLFKTLTFRDGIKEPLAFGLLFGSISSMLGLFWQVLTLPDELNLIGEYASQLGIGFIFVIMMVIVPILVTLGMLFYSAFLHLLLLIVRGGKNGYEATFRVVAYSQAIQLLVLVPFVGVLIGLIWQIIVQIIGLAKIHEVSYARIIIAFLIPVIFLTLLIITVLAAVMLFIF